MSVLRQLLETKIQQEDDRLSAEEREIKQRSLEKAMKTREEQQKGAVKRVDRPENRPVELLPARLRFDGKIQLGCVRTS